MPSHLILITFICSRSHSQNICIAPLSARTWCQDAGFLEYKKNLFLGSPLLSREVSLDYSLWSVENLGSAHKEEEHNENKWPNRGGMGRSKEEKILFWSSKTSLEVIGKDDAKGEKGFHNSIQNEASFFVPL